MKVLESTSKGVGNYFHRTWQSAVKDENNFIPVFIAWCEIDLYELNENGKEVGAVEGNHDDCVMATAILIWVRHTHPLPSEIKSDAVSSRRKTRFVGGASI